MTHAYLNYPAARVSLHTDPECWVLRRRRRPTFRVCRIEPANLAAALAEFETRKYCFRPEGGMNDLWLVLDLGDERRERDVVIQIVTILARRYRRFENADVSGSHC